MTGADDIAVVPAILISMLLVGGAAITLIGAFGLIRLRTFYERVHAPTLGSTLGTVFIAAASMIAFWCGEFFNSFILAKMKLGAEGKQTASRIALAIAGVVIAALAFSLDLTPGERALILALGLAGFALGISSAFTSTLMAALAALSVASSVFRAEYTSNTLITPGFTIAMLAIAFLGPSEAFAIALIGEAANWVRDRYRWRALLINLAGVGTPTLIVGEAFHLVDTVRRHDDEARFGLCRCVRDPNRRLTGR